MRHFAGVLAAACGLLLYSTAGHAQATRTWVSGVGNDVNPCSRTAPCKTFAGAISKTATGGEISVLDPGGFGAVTITKSITINGDGTLAGILAAGTNGIIISSLAPATTKVTLRNLSINGAGTGINGVRVLGGAQTIIDNCTIQGFTGAGVDIAPNVTSRCTSRTAGFQDTGNGVAMFTSGSTLLVSVDDTTIVNTRNWHVRKRRHRHCDGLAIADRGLVGRAGGISRAQTAQINVDGSNINGNATAFNAGVSGSVIRISNNNIYNNATGYTIAGGATIASTGNNRTGGNGARRAERR